MSFLPSLVVALALAAPQPAPEKPAVLLAGLMWVTHELLLFRANRPSGDPYTEPVRDTNRESREEQR